MKRAGNHRFGIFLSAGLAILLQTACFASPKANKPADVSQPRYAPRLLVEVSDLGGSALRDRARILDVRPWDQYKGRHITGAVWVDVYKWAKLFTAHQSQTHWQERIGALGVDSETTVVICDDGSGREAACLRAILRYAGVKDVRIVNGGWPSWLFLGGYQDDTLPKVAPLSIKLKLNTGVVAPKHEIATLLQSGRGQVIDARPSADSSAQLPSVKPLEWRAAMQWREYRFKTAADLASVFHSAGIDVNRPTIVYADSPGEAALLGFAMELLGAKQVRIYFPGWDG